MVGELGQVAGTRVGIVGTGWMAETHTEALRRLGIEVAGVAGRTPERAREAADRLGLATAYDSVEALVKDDSLAAVHVTSPNDVHAEQAAAALRAGRHVVCEKPLGVTAAETAALAELAAASGLVNAVCFNLRFAPHNHNAAGMVRAGELGEPRYVTGSYHQDWLLEETDWNWRLVAGRQGSLRAVADIGSHWLDLVSFVSGRRVTEVLADLHTFVPERNHPLGEVGTFAAPGWPTTSSGSGSRCPATTPPASCCAWRAACAGCARSARCRPGARTGSAGSSTAPGGRWPGPRRSRSTCGSGTGAGPTSCRTRTRG